MIVPLIVACALFMENLDGTVITTALPAMAESFGTSPIHLSLGITVYMFSLGIFIPISGWVADRFGARTVFRAAIGVFTLGSILCGLTNWDRRAGPGQDRPGHRGRHDGAGGTAGAAA